MACVLFRFAGRDGRYVPVLAPSVAGGAFWNCYAVKITARTPGKRPAWAVVFVERFVAIIANIGRRVAVAAAGGQPRWPPGRHEWNVPNGVSPAIGRRQCDAVVDGLWPRGLHRAPWMAVIAQLVERQVVVLDVTGSSPVARPTAFNGTVAR